LEIPVSLIKGDKGIFEVRADGELIYSKKACGDRFPAGAEIVERITGLLRRSGD
jgi:selT/selW/selH-like putative selenoprotein